MDAKNYHRYYYKAYPNFLLGIILLLTMGLISCNSKNSSSQIASETSLETVSKVTMKPADPPTNFKHQMAEVNGVNIHYVIGGKGDPLVLIHGFGQNWYMWNRILPELSKHFTVIAPDLRGVGESDKPDSGYDKKTMASDIHELVKHLGYDKINIAGHDIGLMVAYAYAVKYENEVNKIALMDALLPGVEPVWSQVSSSAWWFGFFGWPASGEIVKGKEKEFLTNFWPVVGHIKNPFTEDETNEFIRAYAMPGATTASFQWFGNFPNDAIDNKEFMKKKLKTPLLAMGGEYFAAAFLKDHSKLVAEDVYESKIEGAGHWIVQENTKQVEDDLLKFFTNQNN
tara:strand:- start:15600 stop:16622 length:1023 start_codon:yes stop_codon:yes gene_type:complete